MWCGRPMTPSVLTMAVFDDDFAAADSMLDDAFGTKSVSYQPVFPGTARTISVSIHEAQEADTDDAGDEKLVERIWVLCDRDATTGIDNPQMGDLITRSVADDPDRRPYVFTGQKEDITQSSWVLVFARAMHVGRGPRG